MKGAIIISSIDLKAFEKGQVWKMDGESWTPELRNSGITVGDRPVIIYRTVEIRSGFVTVIPTSMNPVKKNGVRLKLEENKQGIALVQEIRPVPISKLTTFLGTLNKSKLEEIDNALKIYLGLEEDPELEKKVFYVTGPSRPYFNSRECPAPTVYHAKPIEKEEIINDKPAEIEKPKKPSKSKNKLSHLTQEEKEYVKSHKIKEISNYLHISTSTAYRYRRALGTNVSKTEKPDYSDKIYKNFYKKNLNIIKEPEKRLFLKLNPEKLSKFTNLPIETINEFRERFSKELNINL